MKTVLTLILTVMSVVTFSQSTTVLDQNNVGAVLKTNGVFFNKQDVNASGYSMATDSGKAVIYSSGFWFSGTDVNNNFHLAATRYGTDYDVFCGPVSTDYSDNDYANLYGDKFWKITKTEINNHYYNYQQPGYVMPTVIAEWPANGQSSLGVANDMAPYVDMNSNGIYDPENGDYPNIRGDMAVYIIMNDDADVHSYSGGEPLKMEFHYMFYQYSANGHMDNTTFISLKVINRSVNTYSDFKVGYFVDPDIGGSSDDYVGCAPSENLMFAYNGDSFDDGTGGYIYGDNPPAVGIKFLNHDLDVFTGFAGNYLQHDPVYVAEYQGFMNAMWGDSGLPFTYGGTGINGTVPTNYQFSGSLTDTTEWSEVSFNIDPGDRRMVGITEANSIGPNESICYDYAVIYNRSGVNNIENAVGLTSIGDQVQNFYDGEVNYGCDNVVLNTIESKSVSFEMYPNPSNGTITLQSGNEFDVTIHSISGAIIYENNNINSTLSLNIDVPTGIYFVTVTENEITFTKKLVIAK